MLEPDEGPLAVGEGSGPGRMPEPEDDHAPRRTAARERSRRSPASNVVVTAGPTREPIDPVRFISNHSSGKMGVAIARGSVAPRAPMSRSSPGHVDVRAAGRRSARRQSRDRARKWRDAVAEALPTADVLIMAAAPADFRPAAEAPAEDQEGQRPLPDRSSSSTTEDILQSTISQAHERDASIVGFALETNDGVDERAREARSERSSTWSC